MPLQSANPDTAGLPQTVTSSALLQTQSWCRYDPMACLRQVGLETGFLTVSYVFTLWATRSPVPDLLKVAQFALLFALLSFAGRQISDGLGDKISITALAGLGSKLIAILAPKFVAW